MSRDTPPRTPGVGERELAHARGEARPFGVRDPRVEGERCGLTVARHHDLLFGREIVDAFVIQPERLRARGREQLWLGQATCASGAEIRASSTVSATNCSNISGAKSEVEQTAVRPPSITRSPSELEPASISFSISPSRTETVASVWAKASRRTARPLSLGERDRASGELERRRVSQVGYRPPSSRRRGWWAGLRPPAPIAPPCRRSSGRPRGRSRWRPC